MKALAEVAELDYGYETGAGQMGSGSTSGNSWQLVKITGTINSSLPTSTPSRPQGRERGGDRLHVFAAESVRRREL